MRNLPELLSALVLAALLLLTLVGGHLRVGLDVCEHEEGTSSLTAFRFPEPDHGHSGPVTPDQDGATYAALSRMSCFYK